MTGQTRRLEGRIAVVTGASRGIGAAVAQRFAAEGAHVVAVGRTIGALEELDDAVKRAGGSATLAPFDLTDYAAIDRLGATLFERYKRLDILVGNAATLGSLTPMAQMRPAEFEQVMGINLTANFRLIRSLDPLLRSSPSGRAIFVTSGAARAPRAYWSAYAVSKAALEMMVGIYAAETVKTALRVNLVDPGRTRTAMRAKAYPGEDPATLPTPEAVTGLFVELAEPACTRHGERISAQSLVA
jgi:NAD(P)-dependent dehydrogenase (short-subunit alcohol dehydrogenase family)